MAAKQLITYVFPIFNEEATQRPLCSAYRRYNTDNSQSKR